MEASSAGHDSIVTLLLEAGTPWNAIDKDGNCAGDLAVAAGHDSTAESLLEAGRQSVHHDSQHWSQSPVADALICPEGTAMVVDTSLLSCGLGTLWSCAIDSATQAPAGSASVKIPCDTKAMRLLVALLSVLSLEIYLAGHCCLSCSGCATQRGFTLLPQACGRSSSWGPWSAAWAGVRLARSTSTSSSGCSMTPASV